ncbi:DNA (cytosine-5-)-methyltransferase [Roseibium polysiphoniae]|uniref:Cytosine-specific methyltransferase n=1 Tax=Roseibium polysiphoniae TaxID=2571221 RepID=A0A944GSS9_9HYPH|nr:DNA (cytosine-5-)-methyltransferase [Roseibium polysiphoniae]MBS8260482.1 DNA (cytosine-5-)-methyltransferase [Roseibium polysiphoniae]
MTEFADLAAKSGLSQKEIGDELGVCERTVRRYTEGETSPKARDLNVLRGLAMVPTTSTESNQTPAFRFIDLFAGIGGLRRGFEAVGGRCVFTSEWDKYSQKTYRANFPEDDHEISGDITEIEASDIPAHDVLLAGFPCQPFSIAGVSKKNALGRAHGFDCDTQGTLFFDVQRIIAHHRPKAFLLENVKNLVSHDKGRTFQVIKSVLKDELGYHIDWKVIDAKAWLPQHRERIFIVGFKENSGFSFSDFDVPDVTTGPKLGTILHPEDGEEAPDHHFTGGNIGNVSDKYTLTDKLWAYLQGYAAKHKAKGNGFGFGLVGPDDVARTLSARYYKDGSEILVKRKSGNPRRLTPRECARLMGFEGPRTQEFKIPVSDTQAYRQFGNSVCVPVVEAVAKHMEPHIKAMPRKTEKAA